MSSCHIDCACTGLLSMGVMNSNQEILPPKLLEVVDNLRKSGANLRSDVIFSFFWDDNQNDDLDMWVSFNKSNNAEDKLGYSSGNGKWVDGVKYKSFNDKLNIGLDVDAWATNDRPQNGSVENIGLISSELSPDGVYSLYLDNYNNRSGRDTPFNFMCLYKPELGGEFTRVLWVRGIMSKWRAKGNGDIYQMLHVVDLEKEGRAFKLKNVTTELETVFQYEFGNL